MSSKRVSSARPGFSGLAKLLLAASIIALAFYFLVHHLGGLGRAEILRAVHGISTRMLWASGALTCISFLALGGYDIIAVRMIASRRISPQRAWLVGAVANAISNTLGFHALTATAVRYRLLTRSGLTGAEVAGVAALSWATLALGFASMFSIALAASAQASAWQRMGGLFLLGMLVLSALWLGAGKVLRLRHYTLRLPSGRMALVQMALGAIEMAAAIGGLYVLMPPGATPSFAAFSMLYIGAVLLGIASHAPGGLGVFEAAMLALSGSQLRAAILAALLLYRVIYNLAPFILAGLALAAEELRAAVNSKEGSS